MERKRKVKKNNEYLLGKKIIHRCLRSEERIRIIIRTTKK